MKNITLHTLALSAVLGCSLVVSSLSAQESTAGGTLGAQASWTALQNMLSATNGNVSLLRTDVNAMKACAAQKKIWDPAKGCIAGLSDLDTSLYDKMIDCGDQGKIYDKSANTCVNAASTAPRCRTVVASTEESGYMSNPLRPSWCPDGIKSITTPPRNVGGRDGYDITTWTCYKVVCN